MAWRIDPSRSRIEFAVRHMVIATARGRFTEFAGEVVYDEQEPVLSSVEARIGVESLTTGERERDAVLLAADFLNPSTYPEIIFRSRRLQPLGPDRGRITGDLTIRDVTQRVALETRMVDRSAGRARFAATTALSRKAWGLSWSPAVEAGGLAVGDQIKVSLVVEIVEG